MNSHLKKYVKLVTCVTLCISNSSSLSSSHLPPHVITSKVFLDHRSHDGHPECPERIQSFLTELSHNSSPYIVQEPTAIFNEKEYVKARNIIKGVHDYQYIKQVYTACEKGYPSASPFDTDTYMHPTTFRTCIYAQSAWINAVDIAVEKKAMAFAVSRPPGHHAMFDQTMGFCIFNFAVGAAHYAIEKYGFDRIGIIDFDVHYGNGIADLVKHNPKIRYTSLHQEGIFPQGRGKREEGGYLHNILNIPLPVGTMGKEYLSYFNTEAIPFIHEFSPQLVIVSAGYDALLSDELAELSLVPGDYYQIGRALRLVFGDGIVFGLEGGYNLKELPLSLKETLRAFV
eukprot:gene6136-6602_t